MAEAQIGGPVSEAMASAAEKLDAINVADITYPEDEGTESGEIEVLTKDEPAEAEGEEAPPEAEESTEYWTPEEYLKEQGIEGFGSVKEFKEAQDAEFQRTMEIMKGGGFDSKATNLRELNEAIISWMAQNEQNQPSGGTAAPEAQPQTGQGSPPLDVSKVLEKWEDTLGMTDEGKTFYNELSSAITAPLREAQSLVARTSQMNDLLLTRQWYETARSEAGDEAIPPFHDAVSLLTPQAKADAEFRFRQFKDIRANPMTQVFNQWRTSRNPAGVSNADKAERDKSAKKLAILKGMVKPSAATRPAAKTADTQKEREKLLASVPFS